LLLFFFFFLFYLIPLCMVVNLCRGEFHPIMEGYAGTSLRDETIGASSVYKYTAS
jgi:hypothetical protein